MKTILLMGALALALCGCITNGDGLIGPAGHVSGCFTVHDAGQSARAVCTK